MTSRRPRAYLLPGCALLLLIGLAALAPPAGAASGSLAWYYTDDSPGHQLDAFGPVAPAPGGTMYAAFTWNDDMGQHGDIGLMRLKPTVGKNGPVLWQRTWDNPASHLRDSAIKMTTDPAGNAIVAGHTAVTDTDSDWVVIKWRPTGKKAWVATYGGQSHLNDYVSGVGCDAAGNVYVCGRQTVLYADCDWVVAKFRAGDGKRLWARVYKGQPGTDSEDWPQALVVDAAGNSYSTGMSDGPTGVRDLLTMKVTPGGRIAWTRRVDGPAHLADEGREIALLGKRVIVAGELATSGGSYEAALLSYTTRGSRVWQRVWDPGPTKIAGVEALVVDTAGNAVISGTVYNEMPQRAFLAAWTARGKPRWQRFYSDPSGGASSFSRMVADASGTIWAAGSTGVSGGQQDGLLARYGATGSRRWLRTFTGDGTGDDWFNDLCLWGRGSLIATGATTTGTGYYDLLAAKYSR